ncbi:hypothetical protein J3R30DRAFT_415667 [Lentinula aciculospora]|uniref:XLF-like N-terminal domain-containing protein n=1 Tax=Lentinula aciculospora TaxID=153920 RepID=A0A9W9A7E5_9AGAR|nr:hypothetical protein J3R30DRAFT_415667 [Lentinula aciculospora]
MLICFHKEQSKLLSSKEWLVKVDTQRSTPYLFKFHSSKIDLSCFVMVTDTKSVWTEVLTSSQIARRWRACNKADSFVAFSVEEEEAEEEWRLSIIDNLSKVHTPGGMNNASFEIINSRSSDFAFEIEYEGFKWTWEACFIGYKNSAEIISKHLLLPLISLTHTVLSVGKPAGEMAESELEKAIDGVGRAARRSFDTHVKNAISKPRMNTSIRRMTALFSLADPLPPISFMNEEVKLQIASPPRPRVQVRVPGPTKARAVSPGPMEQSNLAKTPPKQPSPSFSFVPRELSANPPRQNSADNSATESDDNEPDAKVAPVAAASLVVIPDSPAERSGSSHTSPPSISKTIYSDSDSSLPRPAMKKKKEASSSEDSEEERRKRVARLKSGTAGSRGGVRQPLKRGGKRF